MAEIVPRAPPYAQQLIKELLEFSFEKRPTAAAALKGPWFQPIGASIPEPQNSANSSNTENPNNSSSPVNSSNNSQTVTGAIENTSESTNQNSSVVIGSTRTRQSSETTTDETSVKRSRANT